MSRLQDLEISSTNISGILPAQWGSLSELAVLDLTTNQLTGEHAPGAVHLPGLPAVHTEVHGSESLQHLSSII